MALTIQDRGFRFFHWPNGQYGWAHPLGAPPFNADCTDMTDEEFAEYVVSNEKE